MPRLSIKVSEDDIHKSIVEYLRLRGIVFFHIPNESRAPVQYRAKLKALGVRAGVPDLCVLLKYGVGFIEIKSPTGRLSPTQKDFRQDCEKRGIPWGLARSIEDAESLLTQWGI